MKALLVAAALAVGLMGVTITAADAHHGHRHCTSWGWHSHHHGRFCRGWGW